MKAVKSYFAGIRRMAYPLAALVSLVIADGVVTNVVLGNGVGREANPFLVSLAGDGSFLVLKAVGALFCAFLLWDIYRRRPRMAIISTSTRSSRYLLSNLPPLYSTPQPSLSGGCGRICRTASVLRPEQCQTPSAYLLGGAASFVV